ncbi:ABC-2 family transporter protein [Brachybacterium sp. FME24]|uniref:ABC transporter permease n=1 Tax=Brachybacterium sp. FME24 TaxID=2742605 RepID=UPI0018671C4D|nr:ABC-2 family transporter protein [Brachybacterium sp. FME24]
MSVVISTAPRPAGRHRALLATGIALFGRDLTVTLTNRAWVVLLQLGAVTPPVVSLLVWTGAIARGATPPVPADRIVTWFVLVAVVSMVTSSWTASFLAEDIRTGGLSIWLVRPCPALAHLVANNLAEKAVKIVVLLPMVVGLGLVFRRQVQLPTDPSVWAAALGALVCAGILSFVLDVLIGCLAFWFEDVAGVQGIVVLAQRLLSGAVVPLMLLPAEVQDAVRFQPFRFTLAYPLEVLTGSGTAELADWLALLAWTGASLAMLALVWARGVRRYEAAGA